MADFNEIGQQFTNYYYNVFDADRRNLASLYVSPSTFLVSLLSRSKLDTRLWHLSDYCVLFGYVLCHTTLQRPQSMLSFEGEHFMGMEPILKKLTVRDL